MNLFRFWYWYLIDGTIRVFMRILLDRTQLINFQSAQNTSNISSHKKCLFFPINSHLKSIKSLDSNQKALKCEWAESRRTHNYNQDIIWFAYKFESLIKYTVLCHVMNTNSMVKSNPKKNILPHRVAHKCDVHSVFKIENHSYRMNRRCDSTQEMKKNVLISNRIKFINNPLNEIWMFFFLSTKICAA